PSAILPASAARLDPARRPAGTSLSRVGISQGGGTMRELSARGGDIAAIEEFERRVLYSTYLVTGPGDAPGAVVPAGHGAFLAPTLRAAVNAANANADADVIVLSPLIRGGIALTGGEL